ncbi:hypothetical protein [Clostridium sp. CTA-6]
MSKETEHLKLFKYDKETDDFNTTTFNIEKALNDNWDKIDVGLADITTYDRKTYAELKALKDANNLIEGKKYLLTDYKTKYKQPTTNVIKEMAVEELILTASSNNTFESIVYSALYPQDTIWYDFNNNICEDNTTPRNGFILRRYDPISVNDCPQDWRTMLWARWKPDANQYYKNNVLTNYSTWTSGNAIMNVIYKANNQLLIAKNTNVPSSATDSNVFSLICDDINIGILVNDKTTIQFGNNRIDLKKGELDERLTFSDNCKNNKIGGANLLHGNVFINNCNHNVIGNSCYHNTFLNNCYSNFIQNSCNSNLFSNNCLYNKLGNDCNGNIFLNNNKYNDFKNGCSYNILISFCVYNSFLNNCNNNSLMYNFSNNNFGNSCGSNNFGNNCFYNNLGDNCSNNKFADGCNYNTLNNGCGSNNFGDNCGGNYFGNNSNNNNFADGCNNNSFGNNCSSNSFGTNCLGNNFGNYFISNSFENNCDYNCFGNDCLNNKFKEYCNFNFFFNNCGYITFNRALAKVFVKGLYGKDLTNLNIYAKSYSITFERKEDGTYVYWYLDSSNRPVYTQIP